MPAVCRSRRTGRFTTKRKGCARTLIRKRCHGVASRVKRRSGSGKRRTTKRRHTVKRRRS